MHCWGQRSWRGQLGSGCLTMPYGHQIWWEEPMTRAYCIAGVKGHAWVSQGQPEIKFLRNALWPPNICRKDPDQSVMHWWGQRSCKGQLGTIAKKCVRPSSKANAAEHYAAAGALVYITKIMESVCVYVCMSGYAFRLASRYRAETWHGGRGRAPEVCRHIFEATPPGVKGHPGVNLP